MAEHTNISWADDTFNPWEGCQKVSPACDGCYAEARNLRYAPKGTETAPNWGPGAPRRRTSASNWAKPVKWNAEEETKFAFWRDCVDGGMAGEHERPPQRFVFCASLADVFDNAVPAEWRRDLFDLIRATPHLTWLLLTKRPGNIIRLFNEAMTLDGGRADLSLAWPRNAAIGFSAPNQEEFDQAWPKARTAYYTLAPAFVFLSDEPALGPLTPPDDFLELGPRAWVIAGGETDQGSHKARPSHPDWFRSLRDQCAAAVVPFHFKQWGEWAPDPELDRPFLAHHSHAEPGTIDPLQSSSGQYAVAWTRRSEPKGSITEGVQLKRVGKKASGRLLDGVEHNARPTSAQGAGR